MERCRFVTFPALWLWLIPSCAQPHEEGGFVPPADLPAHLQADADDLKRTVVTPHLEQEIGKGINVLWCASFQLAWNELAALSGGQVALEGKPAAARVLNRRSVTRKDVPPDGLVAEAGLVGDGAVERIRRKAAEAFAGSAAPRLPGALSGLPDDAVVAYACLHRGLPFAIPFRRLDGRPFWWRRNPNGTWRIDRRFACFGIAKYAPDDPAEAGPARQVRIIWHRYDWPKRALDDVREEYVVELQTTSQADRLILARIDPGKTLAATIARVRSRMAAPNTKQCPTGVAPELQAHLRWEEEMARAGKDTFTPESVRRLERAAAAVSGYACLLLDEDLTIPVLDFDVIKNFGRLTGRRVTSGGPKVRGKPLALAAQQVRFKLDESGAVLESEAAAVLFGGRSMRDFSFLRPFLVMLLRKGADQPYFALWVGNDELLVPHAAKEPEPATRAAP